MAGQGQTIIIKKKKGGGHGGAHGGAWKVAYADFVTAMMCFFLVMWLMGADEEIKEAISHYFNHPNTPYDKGRDPQSEDSRPLGENIGPGEEVLNGREGLFPDELIENMQRPIASLTEHRTMAEMIQELTENKAYAVDAGINDLTFSIPENELFDKDTVKLNEHGKLVVDRLGKVFKSFEGHITISGHVNFGFKVGKMNPFEFSLARAVNVMNYLIDKNYAPASKMTPKGSGSERAIASEKSPLAATANPRIEFTLSSQKNL